MGVLSALRSALSYPAMVRYVEVAASDIALGMSAEELYESQPHLRTVIDFRARNVGQLSLPLYSRRSDTDRELVKDDPVVRLLARPNPTMTAHDLLSDLVHNLDLYDTAYWLIAADKDSSSGWQIQPIPPSWVTAKVTANAFAPEKFIIQPGNGTRIEVPADKIIHFHGWNPTDPTAGSPTINALKDTLADQVESWRFRRQMWKRGGRVGSYLTRPKDAPDWKPEDRDRFVKGWREFTDAGAKAGSTPLLEDGLELKRVGFSAKDEQWLEASKLSLQTTAAAYHVSPIMVGILDNANFSNTREFRKMLYSETLMPLLVMIQQRLNAFLLPIVCETPDAYLEFNIAAKLAGDFEEQASVLSTSVGRPWMTVNEARAKQNLPALPGGEHLSLPLNVAIGGQASPQSGGDPLNEGTALDTTEPPAATVAAPKGADELLKLGNLAGILIRSGFDPVATAHEIGLPDIPHLGLVPVSLRDHAVTEAEAIQAEEEVAGSDTGDPGSDRGDADTDPPAPQDGTGPDDAETLKAALAAAIEVAVNWKARQDRSNASRKAAGAPIDWPRWERELQADLVIKAGLNQFDAGLLARDLSNDREKEWEERHAVEDRPRQDQDDR